MADITFVEWMIVKTIDTKYGEMKKLSFKVSEFKNFLDTYNNNWWINVDIKKSKEWKEYATLNTWKAEGAWQTNEFWDKKIKEDDISIPF